MFESYLKPDVNIQFETLTDSIVEFDSQYAGLPLKSCKVAIPVTQEGEGDPSPENVRNFVGVDSLDFSATGKNLWGGKCALNGFTRLNIESFSYDESTLRFGGPQITQKVISLPQCKENTRYTIILTAENTNNTRNVNLTFLYSDGTSTNLQSPTIIQNTKTTWAVVSSPNKTLVGIKGANYSGTTTLYYNECGLFEGVKTADDFVPFGDNKTFTFGQTIYAGELDVLTGILSPKASVKIKDLTWTYQSANLRFWSTGLRNTAKLPTTNSDVFDGDCECYKAVQYFSWSTDKSISLSTSGDLFIKDTNYTDVASFLEAVGDYEICYALAIPEVINLGGMKIETLQGTNNLFASTGTTTASYIKIG